MGALKKRVDKLAMVVLDATGSMAGQERRVVSSLNEYVEVLAGKGVNPHLLVFLFDSERWHRFYDDELKKWKRMELEDYNVGAMTPLYDAIGKGINYAARKIKKGGKVHIMIDTDGYENASQEYSLHQIQKMIERRKKQGWDILFMGSGVDKAAARRVSQTGVLLGTRTGMVVNSTREATYSSTAEETRSFLDD